MRKLSQLNKHKYKAQVVLTDKPHDLALLQIDAPNLTPAVLSNSQNLQVGQKVYAIGNPFGLSGTMTPGIISAMRSIRGPEGNLIENAIQTDAAINPGNSGGPLLNSHGEVIGINYADRYQSERAIEQSSGIGFAIPINTAKAVLEDFAHYGRSPPAIAGHRFPAHRSGSGAADGAGGGLRRADPACASRRRCGARGIARRAPAGLPGQHAHHLGGDLIVAIDGRQITSALDLSQIMDDHKTGDTVTVSFLRGQRKMTVRVMLEELGTQTA